MRHALWWSVVLVACGTEPKRYEGEGTAVVEVVGRPADSRTRTEPAEQARARFLRDERIEVQLDECAFTTEPAVGGRASIPPGMRCRADRSEADVLVTVESGEVALDETAGTLTVQIAGSGRASRLGEHLDVRYRYSFTGTRR